MKAAWKSAEEEFVASFDRYGKEAYVCRLTDTAAAKATSGKGAFVQAQPSDYIVVLQGQMFYAEVKSSNHEVSFPHSNIRKGQMAAARKTVAAKGTYLFFLKNLVTNQWYCVPASVIIADNKVKKSTRWADIEQYKWDA